MSAVYVSSVVDVTDRSVECKSEMNLFLWGRRMIMLLRLDLFGDQITKLIYCFCIGDFVSSVHFELNCNIWGFEACLR